MHVLQLLEARHNKVLYCNPIRSCLAHKQHGRDSSRLYHQAATGEDSVTIEVFGHAAIGNKEAVFVAYLSNSVLLVIRLRGGGTDEEAGGNSLRSWLLDWPVQGKVRMQEPRRLEQLSDPQLII